MENNEQKKEENQAQEDESKVIPKVAVELSKVAANPKQSIAIIIVGILVALYMVYSILASDDNPSDVKVAKEEKVVTPKVITKPTAEIDTNISVPDIPSAPEIRDPAPPPPPVPLPVAKSDIPKEELEKAPVAPSLPDEKKPENTSSASSPPPVIAQNPLNSVQPIRPAAPVIEAVEVERPATRPIVAAPIVPKKAEDPETIKKREEKRKSSIMLISGTQTKTQEEIDQSNAFKKRSNLGYVLAKGKILDAVIETAINTDFPSEVRAVITRDVYAEGGKTILIPKGSKVFGNFATSVDVMYGRISITWTRIDLPTGYILNFQGNAIDALGRNGTVGRLDTKFQDKVTNVVLSTALNVAFASALDKLVPPEQPAAGATVAQNQATGLQSTLAAIMADTSITDPNTKITNMCSAARQSITDTTSPAYAQINTACAITGTSTPQSVYAALTSATTAAITTAAAASNPTKAQEATQKGMEDFSKTLEDIVKKSESQPTITINQGEHIKIYVTTDYVFPKAAVQGSRLLQ